MASLGIDATNLCAGGGLTHIVELLRHAEPESHGFDRVVIWGGKALEVIDDRPWLEKHTVITDQDSYLRRMTWATRNLQRAFRSAGCDLLFCPAGSFSSRRVPYVSMSQNMLLYDDAERRRFPWGWNRLRYNLLRIAQRRSFRCSAGNIFISRYAFERISDRYPFVREKPNAIIYHGVSNRFSAPSMCQRGESESLRLLYVSRINYYKHQWNVVAAVNNLNRRGQRIELRLVGDEMPALRSRLANSLAGAVDGSVVVTGHIPYEQIEQEYLAADAFVFASTCENMPNILVEAMCAGLPIACSSYGPMPEILADSGIYFDPLSIESIESALAQLSSDGRRRQELSQRSVQRAALFSWKRTASETFAFLGECLQGISKRARST